MNRDKTENELVPLIDLQSSLELEMLRDILQQEKIPTITQENGSSGNYLKIYMGYSAMGETLYVRQKDYLRAQELLQALRQNGEAAIDEAQPQAFGDAETFEQYENTQNGVDSHNDQKKSLELLCLLAVVIILVVLKGLNLFT